MYYKVDLAKQLTSVALALSLVLTLALISCSRHVLAANSVVSVRLLVSSRFYPDGLCIYVRDNGSITKWNTTQVYGISVQTYSTAVDVNELAKSLREEGVPEPSTSTTDYAIHIEINYTDTVVRRVLGADDLAAMSSAVQRNGQLAALFTEIARQGKGDWYREIMPIAGPRDVRTTGSR